MPYFGWFLLIGLASIGIWQFAVWQGEVRLKKEMYRKAIDFARSRNKPLLIAGGPYGHRRIRHLLRMPAHGGGNVCLDIDRNAVEGHPKAVIASVTNVPFSDKSFGAAFASHLLEHLPTTAAAKQALAELNRVADGVFIASPSRQSLSGWLHPDHHLWVWQNGQTTFVEQRGKVDGTSAAKKLPSIEAEPVRNLEEEADLLAMQLFRRDSGKRAEFTRRVLDICRRVEGRDFLVIHNPGGWGGTPLPDLLEWEKSVIDGVLGNLDRSGCSHLLVQHFRGGSSQWEHALSMREQTYFLFTGHYHLADEMAAETTFIASHFPDLKIIMLGASQGAAFGNAVMRRIGGSLNIYSIELGLIFPHKKRRIITAKTLAVDSNGHVPDPIVHLNLRVALTAYFTAPYRWLQYRLEGHPKNFSYCINAPGHDYNWKYPGVSGRIEEFLNSNFGKKAVGG
ncbi:MAG: methyltransferase domain-containing protein [Dehalococcoidales bacterium]|nr:methyltransferase domain-containing protein [Dehalococcoidales bacterium]